MYPQSKSIKSSDRRDNAVNERQGSNGFMRLDKSLQSQYDMWSWVYPEIATIRMEVSRLGTLVRVNSIESPNHLESYLCQMKALIQSINIITDVSWQKVMEEYKRLRNKINEYHLKRRAIPNLKIPVELIDDLDEFYRICLLMAQMHGLGIKIADNIEIDKAIESAFTK